MFTFRCDVSAISIDELQTIKDKVLLIEELKNKKDCI